MSQEILIIKDPEVAKLFADETRRQMLHYLRHHELSTTDLAKALGKSHSSIIYHLKLLQDAGLVEEARVEKKRNLVQTYYRSTARKFIISYSLSESLESTEMLTWQKEMLKKIVSELGAFGIKVPKDDEARLLELLGACLLREQKAFEETIEQQVGTSKIERPVYAAMIRLLTQMRLSGDREHASMIDELGEMLKYPQMTEAGEGL